MRRRSRIRRWVNLALASVLRSSCKAFSRGCSRAISLDVTLSSASAPDANRGQAMLWRFR